MALPIESLRLRHEADEKYLQNISRKNMDARLGPSVTEECGTEGVERYIQNFTLETWRTEGNPLSNSDVLACSTYGRK
jgi:hypothetical protein